MRHYVRYGPRLRISRPRGERVQGRLGKGRGQGGGDSPRTGTSFSMHCWSRPADRNGRGAAGGADFLRVLVEDETGRPGNYWGNWFQPQPDQIPALETWTCVEWRVKANTGAQENGELDCWINGKKCGEFRNINWRSVDTLRSTTCAITLWLEPGSYERLGGGTTRTVWYDDVVVATKHIGPKIP